MKELRVQAGLHYTFTQISTLICSLAESMLVARGQSQFAGFGQLEFTHFKYFDFLL